MSKILSEEKVVALTANPDSATKDDISSMATELVEHRDNARKFAQACWR